MWLIERFSDGTCRDRITVPAPLRSALVRWYLGEGDSEDEAAGIVLVQQARIGGKWFACDCAAAGALPPILTPAYLSDAETYYLRRLTGAGRPEHRDDCPFFRDQATARLFDSQGGRASAAPPDGFFEVLRPNPEKLAQRPDVDAVDDRTRHPSLPMLARLLRRLLLVAARTVIAEGRGEGSIGEEFRAIRRAAERIEAAPGIALARVLWTHAGALETRRAFAALRELTPHWPPGHAPQGFLLLFSREFHGHWVHPVEGEPIHVANRVQSPALHHRPITPPFLALIVIGQYPEAHALAPLRAYAQPVLSGRCFVPVDDDEERTLLKTLLRARPLLRREGLVAAIEKPVFDSVVSTGEGRPRFVLDLADVTTAEHHRIVIALSQDPVNAAFANIGTLISVDAGAAPDELARQLLAIR